MSVFPSVLLISVLVARDRNPAVFTGAPPPKIL
jgi:hypothetical protein